MGAYKPSDMAALMPDLLLELFTEEIPAAHAGAGGEGS